MSKKQRLEALFTGGMQNMIDVGCFLMKGVEIYTPEASTSISSSYGMSAAIWCIERWELLFSRWQHTMHFLCVRNAEIYMILNGSQ